MGDHAYDTEYLVRNKRKPRCFQNAVQEFKIPLVKHHVKFPSRISLHKEIENSEEGTIAPSETGDSEELKPPITHWKRADHSDTEAVLELIKNSGGIMNDLFGEPDVPHLIEHSNFAMLQFNANRKLISFTCVFSYPNIPAVPSFEWFQWMEKNYRLKNASPRNCCFIHYLIWDDEYYNDFLKLALETIFLEHTFLSNIILIKPPKVKIPNIFPEAFIQVLPLDSTLYKCDSDSLQTALICLKYSLMERLKIRLAIVEDHDDLMPIAQQHTNRLKELYGDFCMAEIIEYPGTNDRKTLVCESMGYAVGFMTINRFVDLDLLNSQFDLGVFHGLRKPNAEDKMAEKISQDEENPIYLPDKVDPFLQIFDSETMLKFLNWKPSLCASVEDLGYLSTSSSGMFKQYNELTDSMLSLINETLNVRLAPKFSGHSLSSGSFGSDQEKMSDMHSESGAPFTEFSLRQESPLQSESSLISLQYYNLPTYNGRPNAFCIEFFAVDKNFDERLCKDFLEAAFDAFPDLEYCLLTIPSQAESFPLMDYFTRVTPRPLKRFKQELYVCSKSSAMITFMRVRKIAKSDLEEIQQLLRGIKKRDIIYADIASSCFYEDSAYQGFVLVCSKSIVGVAVLCNEYGMEYLAQQFRVSDLINFELHKIDYHAILKHLVLSPIFQPHARFFLRDVMRVADVTSLYRARYEEAENNWFKNSLITVLGQLVPVKPRRMVQYHEPSLDGNLPPPHFLQRDLPFSLYHINSRLCSMKKFTSNVNLVVVGASRTAFAFLETLLFAPSSAYVTYTNITWVSPHGMGTELPSHPAKEMIFPFRGKYNRYYKIQICLKSYVNFVYGVMTHINRAAKYITINDEAILPYDYLILLCGRQYAMPVPCTLEKDVKECQRSYRPRCTLYKYLKGHDQTERASASVYPGNVFLINTEVDATNAFISLQYLVQKKKGFPEDEKIIIYGYEISAYLCISALIKYGIPPTSMVLIEPFPHGDNSISCFLDHNIDTAVLKTLKDLGIDHYKGYVLYDWILCENKQVQKATFHTHNRRVTINCLAMFPFDKRIVSHVTFKAVNEASLVYDRNLVINSNFQTNDPHIYAAGGLTKYQRKYYANDKSHWHYSANEVGRHLGNIIRKKIDPTETETEEEVSDTVPTMADPVILYGHLPDGWHYFRLLRPGKIQDPETRASIKEFGDVLVTGNCEMSNGQGYFKLILDDCGFVEAIFCYTKDDIDTDNLEKLYGKHEKLLNNLLLRFDLGMIKDFYSYFREPWVYAIFHDEFKLVLEKNNELFNAANEKTVKKEAIVDMIVAALKENNWLRPSEKRMREIMEMYDSSNVKQEVAGNILDFLYYFSEPFPMYATPGVLRVLLRDSNTSLLHKLPESNCGFRIS